MIIELLNFFQSKKYFKSILNWIPKSIFYIERESQIFFSLFCLFFCPCELNAVTFWFASTFNWPNVDLNSWAVACGVVVEFGESWFEIMSWLNGWSNDISLVDRHCRNIQCFKKKSNRRDRCKWINCYLVRSCTMLGSSKALWQLTCSTALSKHVIHYTNVHTSVFEKLVQRVAQNFWQTHSKSDAIISVTQ